MAQRAPVPAQRMDPLALVASDPGSNRLLATLAEDLGVVAAVVTLVLVTVLGE